MKILHISVAAFGKAQGVELDFGTGVNVMQNANSFGKTTIANFIRAMLYGINYTRTKADKADDERVNDVDRFAPWGLAGKFGGSMTVEHNGEKWRIERFFGTTARQESLTVTNETTGREVPLTVSPGEFFLGLTDESYDRSTYYPQEFVQFTSNENIDGKLANLVDSADYDEVQDRLLVYRRQKRAGRGVGGTIAALDNEIFSLQRQLNDALKADEEMQRTAEQRTATEEQIRQLNARKCDVKQRLDDVKRQIVLATPTEEQQAAQKRVADAELNMAKYPSTLADDRKRATELLDKIKVTDRHPNVQKSAFKPKWWLVALAAVLIAGGAALCFAGQIPLLICGGIAVVCGAAILVVGLLAGRGKDVETLQSTEWDELVTDYMRIVGRYVDVTGKDLDGAAELFWNYCIARDRDMQILKTLKELTPAVPQADITRLTARENALETELESVGREIDQRTRQLGNLDGYAAAQSAKVADKAEIEDKILDARAAKADEEQKYDTAERVSQLLVAAKENLSGSYLPKLRARVTELVDYVTGGSYEVTLDRNFAVRLRENGQTNRMTSYSRGIREITLLCFRIALSELLYDGAVPLLIVDDAFVNFDDDNFARATRLLADLSAKCGTQVIYFTCHSRLGALEG